MGLLAQSAGSLQIVVQKRHLATITLIKFSNEEQYLASVNEKNELIIWDVKFEKEMLRFGYNQTISSCIFSSNSKNIHTGHADGTVKKWNIDKFKLFDLYALKDHINDFIFLNEKLYVASDSLYELNMENNEIIYFQKEVNRLSGGIQTPTSRIENSALDYIIW